VRWQRGRQVAPCGHSSTVGQRFVRLVLRDDQQDRRRSLAGRRCGWQRRTPMPASARSVMPRLNAAGRTVCRPVLAGNRSLQRAGLGHAAHSHLTGGQPRPPSERCPWSGASPGRPKLGGCDATGAGSQLEV
jgi:hypothetical protein